MFRKFIYGAVIALLCSFFIPGVHAQEITGPAGQQAASNGAGATASDVAALEQQSREALEAGDAVRLYVANMKLLQLRPYEPEYMINTVRATALLDRRSTAYHHMLQMQQQGLSFDFNSLPETESIRDTEAYEYINNLMIEAGTPAGEGSVEWKIQHPPQDLTSVSWDASRQSVLLGSLRDGAVLAVGQDGAMSALLEANEENGLWSITGMKADAGRNRLWIATSALPEFAAYHPTDQGRNALLEFNLETLELLERFDLPVDALPHRLGALATTENGHVYVLDHASPIIYRKAPEGEKLEVFLYSEKFDALDAIAVTPDNSRLFVADRSTGIYVTDPVALQASLLSGPETLNLGGISALEYHSGNLVMIQGGISPQRIMRLTLDATGAMVAGVSPMAVNLEAFDQPGRSTLTGEDLLYVANSATGGADAETLIMRTPLSAGSEIVAPDMRDFQKRIRANADRQPDES
ncbi:MAG: hypothetical protein RQ826_17290 [Xanthomonadales bacterium]|nr:hypothetical protein [Xanthomonadales bacterium]